MEADEDIQKMVELIQERSLKNTKATATEWQMLNKRQMKDDLRLTDVKIAVIIKDRIAKGLGWWDKHPDFPDDEEEHTYMCRVKRSIKHNDELVNNISGKAKIDVTKDKALADAFLGEGGCLGPNSLLMLPGSNDKHSAQFWAHAEGDAQPPKPLKANSRKDEKKTDQGQEPPEVVPHTPMMQATHPNRESEENQTHIRRIEAPTQKPR